jgi:SAM-dependent methyltransferase
MTLRQTFEQAPGLYDRVRPGYPEVLFEDLAALGGLRAGARVLELGCGTGQATVPLARRGYEIVAVELGAGLADVARQKLEAFPSAQIVTADFESWPLPVEPFDAVVAATSFHWIDPGVRLEKAADALRPGGALAIISTHHVAGGDAQFFAAVQGCYERWMPGTPAGLRLPAAADVPVDREAFEGCERFGRMESRRYEWEVPYRTQEYLDLLMSYSGHRALEEHARTGLLRCIAALIDSRFGGRISKRYMTELAIANASMELGGLEPPTS